jgi:hypothetical protein
LNFYFNFKFTLAERNVPQPQHGPITDTTRQLEAKLAQVQRDFDEFNRKIAQGEKGKLMREGGRGKGLQLIAYGIGKNYRYFI